MVRLLAIALLFGLMAADARAATTIPLVGCPGEDMNAVRYPAATGKPVAVDIAGVHDRLALAPDMLNKAAKRLHAARPRLRSNGRLDRFKDDIQGSRRDRIRVGRVDVNKQIDVHCHLGRQARRRIAGGIAVLGDE